jgi:hypothetical protein
MISNKGAVLTYARKLAVPFWGILIVISLVLGWFDRITLSYRWVTFWIWTVGVLGLFFSSFDRQNIANFLAFLKKYKLSLITIIVLTTISRMLLIETYPFYFIGDELRDGGLRGYEIYSGSLRGIFGYNWAQGLSSATLCAFAYSVFENSVLTYRVPGALAAIITVVSMLYILPRYITPRAVWIACIAIIADWTHLHFSRTEPLIVISTLLILPLAHLLTINLRSIGTRSMLGMGLIIGTAIGAHASVKPLVFLSIIVLVLVSFVLPILTGIVRKMLRSDSSQCVSHKFTAICFLILCAAVLAGLGPRVYETSLETLLNPSRVRQGRDFQILVSDIVKSYRALIDLEVMYHFGAAYHQLLHSIILRVGLYLGLVCGALFGSFFIRIICIACVIVPITNSALTTTILLDHRMFPLTLLSAILAGYGFDFIISKLAALIGWILKGTTTALYVQSRTANLLIGILLVILARDGFTYFPKEPSSARYPVQQLTFNYAITYALYTARDTPSLAKASDICIVGHSQFVEEIKLAHNREAMAFILPKMQVNQMADTTITDQQEIILLPGMCPRTFNRDHVRYQRYCETRKPYICPPNGEKISIGLAVPLKSEIDQSN